jgi:hypothetical protein
MFAFRLERPDGTAADPPTFRTSVPNWQAPASTHCCERETARLSVAAVSSTGRTLRTETPRMPVRRRLRPGLFHEEVEVDLRRGRGCFEKRERRRPGPRFSRDKLGRASARETK